MNKSKKRNYILASLALPILSIVGVPIGRALASGNLFNAGENSQPSFSDRTLRAGKFQPEKVQRQLRKLISGLDESQAPQLQIAFLKKNPIKLDLAEGDWERSWRQPVPVDFMFGLFAGNLFISSYYQRTVSPNGKNVTGLGRPSQISEAQPYISLDENGKVLWNTSGGGPAIINYLAKEKIPLRLFRGATLFERDISIYLRDTVNRKGLKANWGEKESDGFSRVLDRLEENPLNKKQIQYFPVWRRFLADVKKRKLSLGQTLDEALTLISKTYGATFTTTDPVIAHLWAFDDLDGKQPREHGAVLEYDIASPDLLSITEGIYAGVEMREGTYIEIGFSGIRARSLLINGLRD